MTLNSFDESLSKLRQAPVLISASEVYPEPGQASVELRFFNGTWLRADYWRLIIGGIARLSSFDHGQKYGLPTPSDAIKELEEQVGNKPVTDAHLDRETGDLIFQFEGDIKLQVFNFTGYEVWEMHFPGGTVEYSNYNK